MVQLYLQNRSILVSLIDPKVLDLYHTVIMTVIRSRLRTCVKSAQFQLLECVIRREPKQRRYGFVAYVPGLPGRPFVPLPSNVDVVSQPL